MQMKPDAAAATKNKFRQFKQYPLQLSASNRFDCQINPCRNLFKSERISARNSPRIAALLLDDQRISSNQRRRRR